MISERWLREFVDLPPATPQQMADRLSNLGLEVEGIVEMDVPFSGVIVSRVAETRPHPSADKLQLVTVATGAEDQEVVCGAWNFAVGDLVPLATVGARLSGGLEVGERSIRGVVSKGMICSEAELGLGDDASGILVLEPGFAPLGADMAAHLPYPDVLFDVAVTPNRPDAMSIYGIARDLAASFDLPLAPLQPEVHPSGPPTTATVRVEAPDLCPRFTAREISGITPGPSPLWMRLRLRDAGMRAIGGVVDVTNYVMLEYGQPIHAFDMDLVPDETLVIRRAHRGERLTTLDSVERILDPDDLVVAGPDEALALAGIMGGETSEVSDRTRRVLLEVAHFSAPGILLSGKRHGLRSEAVARFERGVDPALPPLASARASALIAEVVGATVHEGFIDVYPEKIEPITVSLPAGESTRLLGVPLARDTVAGYLRRLGFGVAGDDPMQVTVPTYRPDVARPADLVEEVARLHGFDAIPDRVPMGTGEGLPVDEERRRRARQVMVGAGYFEIMSYSFVGADAISALGLPDSDRRTRPIAIRNPLSEEEGVLRTTLLPGVLRAVRVNQARNRRDVAVFEMGRVFLPGDGPIPDQPYALAFAAAGRVPAPAWAGSRPERDATDAVGLWETFAAAMRADGRIVQDDVPGFHPGRAARVLAGERVLATLGEIHPAVAEAYGIGGRVAVGEIDLQALLEAASYRQFRAPSAYPPVVFDLAFDVAAELPAASLLDAVRSAAGDELESLELFDLFSGPPLAPGRKSLAVRLTFRAPDRTLTDEELAGVRARIVDGAADAVGAVLRGADG
jgi:phenylalanyl-tRNA synthetase beta chain